MLALHDSSGAVVGWLDGVEMLDLNGQYVAFINKDSVISYGGIHVGWWRQTYMRGGDGGVVAFLKDAKGFGVARPALSFEPFKPFKAFKPFRPFIPFTPFKPFDAASWSDTTFGRW